MTVFSQDPEPERYDLGGAEVARPDVGGLLPVFVLDHYEGYRVQLLQDCTPEELSAWVDANAAAVRERLPADLVFVNHVLLGGPVGAATGARFAVKAHGSELEYSMRGNARLSSWGTEALERAAAVIVGSRAHSRGARRGVRAGRSSARDTARSRRRALAASVEGGSPRTAPGGGAARPGEPGERAGAASRRG